MAGKEAIEEAQSKLRSEFLQVLRSRRPAQVPLTVELAKPVANPLYQYSPPPIEEIEIMESCPKADIENLEVMLEEENLYLNIEEGEQGRLPVLILKLKESDKQRKRPVVVFLHCSYEYKEVLRPLLKAYASRGYIAISVDSRYHGERATNSTTYRNVWDLIKLADYLTQREDIDPSRIGITGVSLGGMHAWFAAVADTRYAVVVPVIGVQGFRWAIDNYEWQGRVGSIKPVFKVARDDLGKGAIDKEVVEKVSQVWDQIAPGLASQFDSPYSIPTIAPRPLLILNGAEDPLTPLGGLEIPRAKASQAYGEFHCLDNFKFIAEPGIGHQLTRFHMKESSDWFDRTLTQAHTYSKIQTKMAEKEATEEAQSKFRSEFLQVLRSRRPAQVPLTVELAKPVANPLHQNSPPSVEEIDIMESCPKADIENLEDLLEEENLYLNIEEGEQGRLPLLILKLKESDEQRKRPAVVFLHSSNKYKEVLRPVLKAYASRGYIAISVDSRYHGERATSATTYRDVWDLIKLADYLTQREDIDPSRIGITGVSLGGMHAWFAAVADTRYAVVVPLIGVQGFRWAIDNDKYQGRVNSIKPLFEAARNDLGKGAIDKEVVEKVSQVWDRIAPGLASHFDSPYSIPIIAPRPLLILNGAEDPRCPHAGLEIPCSKAGQAYIEFHCLDNFKFIAEPGIGHQLTRFQVKESSDWFDKFLNP
ncbi:yitV [Mucuna pruriens]|uniref:YitV n=1 Tax=Mucuna pruriens TaxID=157652 RepID=A0A371FN64_MUCPR|nr:yitV [Mucuna pruriens]